MSRAFTNMDPMMWTAFSPPPPPAAPSSLLSAGQSAGIGALLGGGLSLFGALETNNAIQKSMNSAASAFSATAGQLVASGAQQLENNKRQREASVGRIMTSLAASGGLGGQTEANLVAQAAMDYARNKTIIENNQSNQIAAANSQYQAQVASLRSRSQIPVLSALTGAMQGATTGLQLFSLL